MSLFMSFYEKIAPIAKDENAARDFADLLATTFEERDKEVATKKDLEPLATKKDLEIAIMSLENKIMGLENKIIQKYNMNTLVIGALVIGNACAQYLLRK